MDIERILQRYEDANQHAVAYRNTLQSAYDLAYPKRADFTYKHYKGQLRFRRLYDATGVLACKQFANNLVREIFGGRYIRLRPGTAWNGDQMKTFQGGKYAGANKEEQEKACAKFTDAYYNIKNKSNFANQIFNSFREMAISTGAIFISQDPDTILSYTSVPLHQICFEPGKNNTIGTVFRKFMMPASTIKKTYPNAVVGRNITDKLEKSPFEPVELIMAVDDCADKHYKKTLYIIDPADKKFIVEQNLTYDPWVIFRSFVVQDELFGQGPILDLVPTLETLDVSLQLIMIAANYSVKPIMMNAGGMPWNSWTQALQPGSCIVLDPEDMDTIKQLQVDSSSDGLMPLREQQFNVIQQTLNLNPTADGPTPADPRQTATLTNIQHQQWQKNNEALYNRLDYEVVRPMAEADLAVMHAEGLIPKGLKIEYDTPVKQASEQEAIDNVGQAIDTLATFGQAGGPQVQLPLIMSAISPLKLGKFVADRMQVDMRVQTSDQERAVAMQQLEALIQGPQQQPPGPAPAVPPPAAGGAPNQPNTNILQEGL